MKSTRTYAGLLAVLTLAGCGGEPAGEPTLDESDRKAEIAIEAQRRGWRRVEHENGWRRVEHEALKLQLKIEEPMKVRAREKK